MFTSALCVRAPDWKQPVFLPMGEWINCGSFLLRNILVHTITKMLHISVLGFFR